MVRNSGDELQFMITQLDRKSRKVGLKLICSKRKDYDNLGREQCLDIDSSALEVVKKYAFLIRTAKCRGAKPRD